MCCELNQMIHDPDSIHLPEMPPDVVDTERLRRTCLDSITHLTQCHTPLSNKILGLIANKNNMLSSINIKATPSRPAAAAAAVDLLTPDFATGSFFGRAHVIPFNTVQTGVTR